MPPSPPFLLDAVCREAATSTGALRTTTRECPRAPFAERPRFVRVVSPTLPIFPIQGFGTLLSNLGAQRGMPPAPIDTFKTGGSPVSRLYNWNLLGPVLKPFGIELSNDKKALVVAGGAPPPTPTPCPPDDDVFHRHFWFSTSCAHD